MEATAVHAKHPAFLCLFQTLTAVSVHQWGFSEKHHICISSNENASMRQGFCFIICTYYLQHITLKQNCKQQPFIYMSYIVFMWKVSGFSHRYLTGFRHHKRNLTLSLLQPHIHLSLFSTSFIPILLEFSCLFIIWHINEKSSAISRLLAAQVDPWPHFIDMRHSYKSHLCMHSAHHIIVNNCQK